jgi:hypothetical protein
MAALQKATEIKDALFGSPRDAIAQLKLLRKVRRSSPCRCLLSC